MVQHQHLLELVQDGRAGPVHGGDHHLVTAHVQHGLHDQLGVGGGKAADGLVQQEDVRNARQVKPQVQARALSVGNGARIHLSHATGGDVRQPQEFQNGVHPPDALRPGQARTADDGGLGDVLGNAHGRIQNVLPRNEGDVGPDQVRSAVQKLVVVTDAAARGRKLPGQHGEQRAFSGSAGAQDADHLSALHGQVNVVQHTAGTHEFLGHALHAEGSDGVVFFIQHPGGKTAAQGVIGVQVHHVPVAQGNPSPHGPAIEQQGHGSLHHFQPAGQNPVTMQEILAKLEEQGIRAERKSIYDDMETLRDFGMDIHYRRGREGGYYEEKSASDKTEADNTIIHQPDGETGEKSENVQEQIGKESEAPAKISA